jgi:hypothetical protein
VPFFSSLREHFSDMRVFGHFVKIDNFEHPVAGVGTRAEVAGPQNERDLERPMFPEFLCLLLTEKYAR